MWLIEKQKSSSTAFLQFQITITLDMATNTIWSIFARNIQGVWTVVLLPPYMHLYTLVRLLLAKHFEFYRSRIECGATGLFSHGNGSMQGLYIQGTETK
jgi:hypothetical protein